jgi:hypothetical protein
MIWNAQTHSHPISCIKIQKEMWENKEEHLRSVVPIWKLLERRGITFRTQPNVAEGF